MDLVVAGQRRGTGPCPDAACNGGLSTMHGSISSVNNKRFLRFVAVLLEDCSAPSATTSHSSTRWLRRTAIVSSVSRCALMSMIFSLTRFIYVGRRTSDAMRPTAAFARRTSARRPAKLLQDGAGEMSPSMRRWRWSAVDDAIGTACFVPQRPVVDKGSARYRFIASDSDVTPPAATLVDYYATGCPRRLLASASCSTLPESASSPS